MTDYADVPNVNSLYEESQRVSRALENLDSGGFLSSMLIAPSNIPPEPGMPTVMMMAVTVIVPPPTSPALLAELTTWLQQRLVDISAEMTALGVAVPPPAQMLVSSSPTSLTPPMPPMPPPMPLNPTKVS